MDKKRKCKKAIGIVFAALIAVSVFAVTIPSIASEPSDTSIPTEQTIEIEELQQRIYDQGYNYTVAENWITHLSSEERKVLCGYKHLEAPTEPLPENVGFVSDVPEVKTEKIGSLPSSYDAMALGYVTPVKNQGACGSCWLHGAIADFESDVAIGESNLLDFSEQEVGDCNIWSSVGGHNFCEGGNSFMTTNYFTKYGAADEACHPYAATPQTCQNCPILKNVDNWRIITGRYGESQITTIKKAILNYGPVYSTIYASDPGFLAYDSGVYEYWGTEETNHAIVIIGWDDTLSHSRGEGAWLIKNSWGTDWGRNSTYPGCAWVAYGAANIGDYTNAIASYKNTGDKIFYHDECGWMGYCLGCPPSTTAYGAVRFIPSQNSTLTAVDFWAVDINMQYEIKVFDTISGGPPYTFSNQLGSTQTGSTTEQGYYSIPLDTPIPLVGGDDFIVQVKLKTTTGWRYPIPIDYCKELNWSTIATSSGESYKSCDGIQFDKYGTGGKDIGIRARVEVTQPDIWVNPTSFEKELSPDEVYSENLNIGNNGTNALNFEIQIDYLEQQATGAKTKTTTFNINDSIHSDGMDEIEDGTGIAAFVKYDTEDSQSRIIEINATNYTSSSSVDEIATPGYYDGFWEGTTDQGKPVSFNVSGDKVTDFYIEMKIRCFPVIKFHIWGNFPIQEDNFTISSTGTGIDEYTFVGTFISQSEAQGTWYFERMYRFCWGSGTWMAEKPTEIHDMAVTDVYIVPSSPTVGQATTINVTVKNEGNQAESNVPVKAYVDGSQVDSTKYVSLSANQSTTKSFSWMPATAKTYSVKGEVGVVSGETATADNTKIIDVYVTPKGWLSVFPTTGTVDPGSQTDITATFNTTGLSVGEYYANITIANNDPDENPVIVPVHLTVEPAGEVGYFDTGAPSNPYPSIAGTHTGDIIPSQDITVHKIYTYPCAGTGGHTEYVRIYNESGTIAEAYWSGYRHDWHNITFDEPFTLFAKRAYHYEIITGSYPQIIHKPEHTTLDGSYINCTSFVDANGKTYTDWIPAIRIE